MITSDPRRPASVAVTAPPASASPADALRTAQGVLIPPTVHAPTTTVPLALVVVVAGTPAPQGSKRAFNHRTTGKVVTMEVSKRVKPWRAAVHAALVDKRDQPRATFAGAVRVQLEFVMPRPKSMPRTKATPPHLKTPDVDKLARSTLDAITSSKVIPDDKHVVDLHATKRTAELGETAGCHITITELVAR